MAEATTTDKTRYPFKVHTKYDVQLIYNWNVNLFPNYRQPGDDAEFNLELAPTSPSRDAYADKYWIKTGAMSYNQRRDVADRLWTRMSPDARALYVFGRLLGAMVDVERSLRVLKSHGVTPETIDEASVGLDRMEIVIAKAVVAGHPDIKRLLPAYLITD